MTSAARERLAVAAVAGFIALLSVVAVARDAGLGVDGLVLAGHRHTDPAAPGAPPVVAPIGYDGQFMYRLAVSPLSSATRVAGVSFDLPAYRAQRVLYPALAWAASLGRTSAASAGLVSVNLAGTIVLGWLGAAMAQRARRSAALGIGFALFPGFAMTLTRDLAEIVAGVALVGALLALRARRASWAGGALLAAALARESAILVPIAFLVVDGVRRRRRTVVWLVPILGWLAWQVAVVVRMGGVPFLEGGGNLGMPLRGALTFARAGFPDPFSVIEAVQAMFLAGVVGVAGWLVAVRSEAPAERAAIAVSALAFLCLTYKVWIDAFSFLRVPSDLYLLTLARALPTRAAGPLVAASTGVFGLTVVQLLLAPQLTA